MTTGRIYYTLPPAPRTQRGRPLRIGTALAVIVAGIGWGIAQYQAEREIQVQRTVAAFRAGYQEAVQSGCHPVLAAPIATNVQVR